MRSDILNCRMKKFRSRLAAGAAILALSLCPLGASARQGQSQDAPPVMNQGAVPPNTQKQQAPITLQKPTTQQNGTINGNAGNGNVAGGGSSRPAGPPVTENDLHVISRAREILSSQDKWNHSDSANCAADATTFSLFCALQKASTEVTGSFDNRGAAVQEVRFSIDDFVGDAKHYNSRLTDFNNDSSTTFENIQAVLQSAENNLTLKMSQQPAAQSNNAGVPQQIGHPENDPGWHQFNQQQGGYQGGYNGANMAPQNTTPPPATLTLPAGTMVTVRTTSFLASNRNKEGDAFTTILDQPIVVNGYVVARRGQPVIGRVVVAKKEHEESQLGVVLASMTLVDGTQVPVKTELVKEVRPDAGVGGREVAGVATTTGIGAIIGDAAGGGGGAGIGAGIGAAAGILGVALTRGRPTVIPAESVLMFKVDEPVTINTAASQVAFQPVTQDDYGNARGNGDRRQMRPAYGPYGRPGYGYPPPPPSAYYYSPYYSPYPYYGYGALPLPITFGFGYGFGYGRRFGGFRR
jgi:hypothetical protein